MLLGILFKLEKNVGVDFLNLSQFILQWHYVWCSDLNLVSKVLHGFTDGLIHVRSARRPWSKKYYHLKNVVSV